MDVIRLYDDNNDILRGKYFHTSICMVNTIIPTRLNKSGTSDFRIEWDLKRTEIERKQCPKYMNGNVLRL